MDRPKCNRCGGPLDIWNDPETGAGWLCNNPKPLATDDEFRRRWDDLPGDDVVHLLASLEPEH